MEITQFRWTPDAGWETPPTSAHGAELVLAFFELAPFANAEGCRLHNQTMTLTTLSELIQ
jgi:hypothetical protein